MANATIEIKQGLKKAEDELKLVEAEKKKMFANWSNTVININKRDDALANFEEALDTQKTKFKSVKTEIDSAKDEIHVCQIEHERATGFGDFKEESLAMKRFVPTNLSHQTTFYDVIVYFLRFKAFS